MVEILIHWLLSAVSLLIVAQLFKGFQVKSFGTALLAAFIIGVVNASVGFVFTIVTLPLTIVTFGLFLLVINALMLKLSSLLVPGFEIKGVWTIFFGAIVLAIVNALLKWGYSMSPWRIPSH
jgi:putative membrane protein